MKTALLPFTIPAGSTAPISLTGAGFQPKLVVFLMNGRSEAGDGGSGADLSRSIGFAAQTTTGAAPLTQGYAASYAGDGGTPDDNYHWQGSDHVVVKARSSTISTDGRASIVSLDADGLTLAVSEAFGTAVRVGALCMGGDDLAEIATGSFSAPTSGTPPFTTDVPTGIVGADGSTFLMLLWGGSGGLGVGAVHGWLGLGLAAALDEQVCTVSGARRSGTAGASSVVAQHLTMGQLYAWLASNAVLQQRARLTGWPATGGFTLTWDDINTSGSVVQWVMVRGGNWSVQGVTAPGAGGTVDAAVPALTPAAGLVLMNATAGQTAGATGSDDHTSFGAFTRAAQAAFGGYDQNGVTTNVVASRISADSVATVPDGAGTEVGSLAVSAVTADAVTLTSDAGGALAGDLVALLIAGPAEGVGGGGSTGYLRRLRRRRE